MSEEQTEEGSVKLKKQRKKKSLAQVTVSMSALGGHGQPPDDACVLLNSTAILALPKGSLFVGYQPFSPDLKRTPRPYVIGAIKKAGAMPVEVSHHQRLDLATKAIRRYYRTGLKGITHE